MKTGLSLISSPVVDVGRDGEPRYRPSMASLLGEPWRDIRAGPRLGYGLLLTRCGAASPQGSSPTSTRHFAHFDTTLRPLRHDTSLLGNIYTVRRHIEAPHAALSDMPACRAVRAPGSPWSRLRKGRFPSAPAMDALAAAIAWRSRREAARGAECSSESAATAACKRGPNALAARSSGSAARVCLPQPGQHTRSQRCSITTAAMTGSSSTW